MAEVTNIADKIHDRLQTERLLKAKEARVVPKEELPSDEDLARIQIELNLLIYGVPLSSGQDWWET